MGLFGAENSDKIEKIGSLEVISGENIITIETHFKSSVELVEFCDNKYEQGFKICGFSRVADRLFVILDKK